MLRWMRNVPTRLRTLRPNFSLLRVPLPGLSRARLSLQPLRRFSGKMCLAAGMLMVSGLAFFLGRSIGLSHLAAQGPANPIAQTSATTNIPRSTAMGSGYSEEYSGRVVATIYDNVPITREELAEYLIARFGAERLEFLVNRTIVERACKAKGVFVTDNEVEHQFQQDVKGFGPHMTAKLFQEQILSRYKKSILEWKEDVVRPKLMLAKLVRPMVVVEEADLKKGFEARFGPKVQCRMIVFQEKNFAIKTWQLIKDSGNLEQAFRAEAQKQFIPNLAATGGEIPPIHRHFGDPAIERDAFNLKPGEISQVIDMPDRTSIILLCERHLPAQPVREQDERLALHKEIFEMKLTQKISEHVAQLRREANPRLYLARQPSFGQIEREAAEQLKEANPTFRPVGN